PKSASHSGEMDRHQSGVCTRLLRSVADIDRHAIVDELTRGAVYSCRRAREFLYSQALQERNKAATARAVIPPLSVRRLSGVLAPTQHEHDRRRDRANA